MQLGVALMKDIESCNLVCKETAVKPNYDLSKRETYIKLYYTYSREVIIVGTVDNNYIHWLSVTKLDDLEINEQIFNHIANDSYQYVSNESTALKKNKMDYSVLSRSYLAKFNRANDKDVAWKTPFRGDYRKDQIKHNGRFFAGSLSPYFSYLQKQCRFREAGGAYKQVLQYYLSSIEKIDFMRYDADIKPVSDILDSESYLLISTNADVRNLYFECRQLCYTKYNMYMSAVR